jgi:hypothetical protein
MAAETGVEGCTVSIKPVFPGVMVMQEAFPAIFEANSVNAISAHINQHDNLRPSQCCSLFVVDVFAREG